MTAQLTQMLQRLKTDWAIQLQPAAIQTAYDAVGYTQWRDRLLNPVVTVQVFLVQILHGNTACRHLPYFSGLHYIDSKENLRQNRVLSVPQALYVSPSAPSLNGQRVARFDYYRTRNPLPPKKLRQAIP